jgi:hypothetical protein
MQLTAVLRDPKNRREADPEKKEPRDKLRLDARLELGA